TLLPFRSPCTGAKPAGRVEQARGWSGAPVLDDHKSIRSAPVFDDRSQDRGDITIRQQQGAAETAGRFFFREIGREPGAPLWRRRRKRERGLARFGYRLAVDH